MVLVPSPQTPVLSPAKYNRPGTNSQSPTYGQSPLVQDEPSLDDEQFEPILSDEDIIDESDSQVSYFQFCKGITFITVLIILLLDFLKFRITNFLHLHVSLFVFLGYGL